MRTAKGIVFDRDGTLIEYVPYLSEPKDIRLVSGIIEVLKLFKKQGFKLFLHTNQSGVGRGIYSIEDVKKCNCNILKLINLGDDIFDKICIADDFPPSNNTYRKPSPRFGEEIISEFKIAKSNLTYIGDNISDLETAKNIGCKAIGVNYGVHNLKEILKKRDDLEYPIIEEIKEAYEIIMR